MNPVFENDRWRRRLTAALVLTWLVVVGLTAYSHEPGRDEVRAFSIGIAADSFWDLPHLLQNEGHPVAWYALLRLVHGALETSLALPITSFLIAAASVLLFVFRSPFSLPVKTLFVFSALPLYEYSVMARNYGIAMLLMFCIAALYHDGVRHPLVFALLLILLANTNVVALVVSVMLMCLWLAPDVGTARAERRPGQTWMLVMSAGVMLLGVLYAARTVMPDERTVVTSAHMGGLTVHLQSLVELLRYPTVSMAGVLPLGPSFGLMGQVVELLLLVLLILGLTIRFRYVLVLLGAIVVCSDLFFTVHPGGLRHEGVVWVFVLALYWMGAEAGPTGQSSTSWRLNRLALVGVVPLILLWGNAIAIQSVYLDLTSSRSSTKELSEYLKRNEELQDAVVMAEPDYFIEALPYYTNHRIYIPREKRFGNWVRFTTESKGVLSLGELLGIAQAVKEVENTRVLVALGFETRMFERQSMTSYSYNRILQWTPEEWERFQEATVRRAKFWESSGDENFDLYEVH